MEIQNNVVGGVADQQLSTINLINSQSLRLNEQLPKQGSKVFFLAFSGKPPNQL